MHNSEPAKQRLRKFLGGVTCYPSFQICLPDFLVHRLSTILYQLTLTFNSNDIVTKKKTRFIAVDDMDDSATNQPKTAILNLVKAELSERFSVSCYKVEIKIAV
ncbi:MAG: hypothetical protein WBZ36_29850 [Candidatus Nitrosopolaris sp.]